MARIRNLRQSVVLRGIAALLAIGSWMLVPALPVFNGAAAKAAGVSISTRDGVVRFDFADLLTTTELVRGFNNISFVTTDASLVTVTNTGTNSFVIEFLSDGGAGAGLVIEAGETRVLSVPTDRFGSSMTIEQPPFGTGEMSGVVIIQ